MCIKHWVNWGHVLSISRLSFCNPNEMRIWKTRLVQKLGGRGRGRREGSDLTPPHILI